MRHNLWIRILINRKLIKILWKERWKRTRLVSTFPSSFEFLLCIISESIKLPFPTVNTDYCVPYMFDIPSERKMNNLLLFFSRSFRFKRARSNVNKLLLLKLKTTSLYSNSFTLQMAKPVRHCEHRVDDVWTRALTEHMHMPIRMPIHQCILLNEIQ